MASFGYSFSSCSESCLYLSKSRDIQAMSALLWRKSFAFGAFWISLSRSWDASPICPCSSFELALASVLIKSLILLWSLKSPDLEADDFASWNSPFWIWLRASSMYANLRSSSVGLFERISSTSLQHSCVMPMFNAHWARSL